MASDRLNNEAWGECIPDDLSQLEFELEVECIEEKTGWSITRMALNYARIAALWAKELYRVNEANGFVDENCQGRKSAMLVIDALNMLLAEVKVPHRFALEPTVYDAARLWCTLTSERREKRGTRADAVVVLTHLSSQNR